MIVREINARNILSRSKIFEYTVNAYTGCQHACTYCYARFMKRFTGHREAWGEFIDVKINAPMLLLKEIQRKPKGRVWMSGVCDPYQPLESKYRLTGRCLEILIEHGWPVTIQTRSPLVLRDLKLLKRSPDVEVGISITTADEEMRKIFEPHAPPIKERVRALAELHSAGVSTFAMVAPALPGAGGLVDILPGKADRVMIDRLNYHYADRVFRRHGLETPSPPELGRLCSGLEEHGTICQVLF
jgi:DNA repair photolyase